MSSQNDQDQEQQQVYADQYHLAPGGDHEGERSQINSRRAQADRSEAISYEVDDADIKKLAARANLDASHVLDLVDQQYFNLDQFRDGEDSQSPQGSSPSLEGGGSKKTSSSSFLGLHLRVASPQPQVGNNLAEQDEEDDDDDGQSTAMQDSEQHLVAGTMSASAAKNANYGSYESEENEDLRSSPRPSGDILDRRRKAPSINGTAPSPSTTKLQKKKKGVQFIYNEVKEVHVYQAAHDMLNIQITFKRNFYSWFFLLFAFVIGTFWDSVGIWLISGQGSGKGIAPAALGIWTSVWKVPVYLIVLVAAYVSGSLEWKLFSVFKEKKFAFLTFGMATVSTLGFFLEILSTIVVPGTPHFSPLANSGLFLVLFYRWRKNVPTFFQEWICASLAIGGYTLASWPSFEGVSWQHLLLGQGCQLASGMLDGLWAVLMETVNLKSPAILVTYLPIAITDVVLFSLGGLCTNFADAETLLAGTVTETGIMWGLAMGAGGFIIMMLYLAIARSMDILSLMAVYALQTIGIPYCIRCFFGQSKLDSGNINTWGIYLWLGTPLVVFGCCVIGFYASFKREFVQRRIRMTSPKAVANPYKKKAASDGSASGGLQGMMTSVRPTSDRRLKYSANSLTFV